MESLRFVERTDKLKWKRFQEFCGGVEKLIDLSRVYTTTFLAGYPFEFGLPATAHTRTFWGTGAHWCQEHFHLHHKNGGNQAVFF